MKMNVNVNSRCLMTRGGRRQGRIGAHALGLHNARVASSLPSFLPTLPATHLRPPRTSNSPREASAAWRSRDANKEIQKGKKK